MARAKAVAACLLIAVLVLFGPAPAWAEFGKRYALVIGNSDYGHVERLPNTASDAVAIAAALEALRFTVFKGTDLTGEQFRDLLEEFNEAAAGADTVVFYYAGHGFQLNGLNHLAPVDAVLRDRSKIGSETFVLNDIIERIHRRNRQTIVFLDACRNNPLPPGVQNGASQGLAQLETGDGTFIAFATQPGNVSYDGTGRNSPFTEALLTHIAKPGRSISDLMIEVRNDVSSRTLNRQVPWDQSSLRAQFYFNPTPEYIARSEPAQGSGIVIGPAGQSPIRSPDDAAAVPVRSEPQAASPIIIGPAPEPTGRVTAAPVVRLEPAREYFLEDAAPSSEDALASASEPEPAPQEATGPEPETAGGEEQTAAASEPGAAPQEAAGPEQPGTASGSEPEPAGEHEQKLAALDPREPVVSDVPAEPEPSVIDEDELVRHIQSHLARLGCYRLAIDGDWGPGSRRSLEQFYRETGRSASSLAPNLDVLSMLEGERGTICSQPAPRTQPRVAAPAPPKAPAATAPQRPRQQQQRPAAQPKAQPSGSGSLPPIIGF